MSIDSCIPGIGCTHQHVVVLATPTERYTHLFGVFALLPAALLLLAFQSLQLYVRLRTNDEYIRFDRIFVLIYESNIAKRRIRIRSNILKGYSTNTNIFDE
jgi:hypothetical protein